jgi:hypothetical protein
MIRIAKRTTYTCLHCAHVCVGGSQAHVTQSTHADAESLHAIESSIAGGPLTALQYVRDLLDANRLASLTGVDWKVFR